MANNGDSRYCARERALHRSLVSVALFLDPTQWISPLRRRTAVSRYPALWSPDLPRQRLRTAATAQSALQP
jgi:hypothetical protein